LLKEHVKFVPRMRSVWCCTWDEGRRSPLESTSILSLINHIFECKCPRTTFRTTFSATGSYLTLVRPKPRGSFLA